MRMIVSFSSRDIKLQHDELIRSNQPDELRVLSRKLEIALRAWDSWVTYHQGSILSTGVASGCLEIDAAHLGELPKIAEQYRKAIDGTLAVGVGPTLMEALKAQEAVTGQDGIRLYTPDIEKELKEKEEPTAMEALGKNSDSFMEPHDRLVSDPNYVYHATAEHNLDDIANQGLLLHNPSDFTEQDTWPDGKTQPRVYFTPKAHVAYHFAPQDGKPVILRAPKEHAPYVESGTGDVYSKTSVPAQHLQILHSDGNWHPLQQSLSKADHEDAKDATAEIQSAPTVPQATSDLEAEFHKLATEQEDELKHNTDQSDAKQQTKAKVLEILQSVSKQSNKIATLKETSPQAFKAVMDLVGGVIEMARSFSKSEELIKSTPEGIKTYNMLLPKYQENGEKLRASNPPTPHLDDRINSITNSPTVIHVPSSALPAIEQYGYLKNLFSDTGLNSPGGINLNSRFNCEQKALHIDPTTSGNQRPIYGAVHKGYHNPTKLDSGPARGYGDVWLQMQPEVNDRTTFTAHDSFNPNVKTVPHSHLEHVVRRHLHDIQGEPDDPEADYIEAQIHGGISPDMDVHSVHVAPQEKTYIDDVTHQKVLQRATSFGRTFGLPVYHHRGNGQPPEKLYHPDDEVAKHEAAFLNPATGQVVTTGPTHDISFIPEDWTNATDGFVDSEGTFLTREEALNKALSLKNLPMPKKTPKRHPLNLPAGTQFDGDPQGAGTPTSGQEIIVENEDGKKIHRSVQAGSISAVNMRHAPPILGEATVPVSTKNPMGR